MAENRVVTCTTFSAEVGTHGTGTMLALSWCLEQAATWLIQQTQEKVRVGKNRTSLRKFYNLHMAMEIEDQEYSSSAVLVHVFYTDNAKDQ